MPLRRGMHALAKENVTNALKNIMKPAHKKIEKKDQHIRIQPLRGGNLLYITQMKNSWMIQMTKPHFYI